MKYSHALFLIVIISVLNPGCSTLQLNSSYDDKVVIDGIDTEWSNKTRYIEDENILLGIMNDDSFIYVFFASNDERMKRQIFMRGLTVWFDPGGGSDEVFGIKFPVGVENPLMMMTEPGRRSPDSLHMFDKMKENLNELEIIGPQENARFRVDALGSKGVKAAINESGNRLVYELRVPLVRNDKYYFAVNPEPGSDIGVGIILNQFDRSGMPSRQGGMRPNGGFGGGGRRPPEGAPGFERGASIDLEVWTNVKLASDKN